MTDVEPALSKPQTTPSEAQQFALPTWVLVCGVVAFLFAASPKLAFFALLPVGVTVTLGVVSLAKRMSGRRRALSGMALAAIAWPVAIVVSIATIGIAITGDNVGDARAVPTVNVSPTPSRTSTPTPSPASTTKPLTKEDLAALDEAPADPASVVAFRGEPRVAIADTSATSGSAIALLATLPVKGRAPKTGYNRVDKFGTAWVDIDRNGCDTRNDILSRDLTTTRLLGRCKVMTGTLADPYTGRTVSFVRGETTSLAVQVDHVVSLMNAWETGAQQLSSTQRVTLANDPLNLLAVDGPTNSRKGAGDAATWLPPLRGYWCQYVARQISVKATYGLWVTRAEADRMRDILLACPEQTAFTSTFTPNAKPVAAEPNPPAPAPIPVIPPAPPAPAPAEPAPPAPAPPSSVYYKNCTAAREAGAAPVHAGDPGYGKHLDRDGDGIGCE